MISITMAELTLYVSTIMWLVIQIHKLIAASLWLYSERSHRSPRHENIIEDWLLCPFVSQIIRDLALRFLARRQLRYLARLNYERVVDISNPEQPLYYYFNHQTGYG
jgi:hypothetical protein